MRIVFVVLPLVVVVIVVLQRLRAGRFRARFLDDVRFGLSRPAPTALIFKSPDGKHYLAYPWSTPLRDYRQIGDARVATRGDAVWIEPGGDFTYAEFEMDEITYNPGPPDATR